MLETFILSTQDEESELKSLSVWAHRLTSPEQAREFMGESKTEYQLCSCLNVGDVRALRPIPDLDAIPSLNVVWDALLVESEEGALIPDTRPGALGHSGITGFSRGAGLGKSYYRSLRSQIADLANKKLIPIEDTEHSTASPST